MPMAEPGAQLRGTSITGPSSRFRQPPHASLLIEPSQCDRDLLLEIVAWTAAGETGLECDNTHLAPAWAEMRAMIGT